MSLFCSEHHTVLLTATGIWQNTTEMDSGPFTSDVLMKWMFFIISAREKYSSAVRTITVRA